VILDEVLSATGYSCAPLCQDHVLMDFECGHADSRGRSLADWLRDHGPAYQREKLCQVWILGHDGRTDVLGYFTLSPHSIASESINRNDRFDDPSDANEVASLPLKPAFLLGKFALDRSVQGGKLGVLLMSCVYAVHLAAAQQTGGNFLVVDAREPELVSYYEKFGFVRSRQVQNGLTSLYRPTSAIQADLDGVLGRQTSSA